MYRDFNNFIKNIENGYELLIGFILGIKAKTFTQNSVIIDDFECWV